MGAASRFAAVNSRQGRLTKTEIYPEDIMANGGKRPGAGRPKGSVNRATKEAGASFAELARQHTADALKTLVEVCNNKRATDSARVTAANSILDRGYGKPAQAVLHQGDKDKPVFAEAIWRVVNPDS